MQQLHGFSSPAAVTAGDLYGDIVACNALYQHEYDSFLTVAFTHDGIGFPMADFLALDNLLWAFPMLRPISDYFPVPASLFALST